MNSLEGLSKNIYAITAGKGFWDSYIPSASFEFYAYKLAMIHSEVTETLEAIRKDKEHEEVVMEIVDILIRTLDLYQGLKATGEIEDEWDIDKIMSEKIMINQGRPDRHGVRG